MVRVLILQGNSALQRTNKRCRVIDIVPQPRVRTPVKQSPRGSEYRRCDACRYRIGAGDKFCTKCGKPLTSAAPAASPPKQKQRLKTKTKPAAPHMKRKPKTITVPAAPRMNESKAVTASDSSQLERYLENIPQLWRCGRCMQKIPHSAIKCPACGIRWEICEHEDGNLYWAAECVAYHVWATWAKSQTAN